MKKNQRLNFSGVQEYYRNDNLMLINRLRDYNRLFYYKAWVRVKLELKVTVRLKLEVGLRIGFMHWGMFYALGYVLCTGECFMHWGMLWD